MWNYEIQRPLARGSTSCVYSVARVSDGKNFVLKRVSLAGATPREVAAAEREVSLLREMDHPCIVSLEDHFEVNFSTAAEASRGSAATAAASSRGDLCLILEEMQHGDLEQVLQHLRQQHQNSAAATASPQQTASNLLLSDSVIMSWFVQISLAVHYLHHRGIVHADIKTSAVLCDSNTSYVALSDLGGAVISSGQQAFPSSSSWAVNAVGSSPSYLSPERMAGAGPSFAADVWALGVLLLEIAAGAHPFADTTNVSQLVSRICSGDKPALLSAVKGREVAQVVSWMLEVDVAKRPTIDQVLQHPFVKRHQETFIRKLVSPHEALPAERVSLRNRSQRQQIQQKQHQDRWFKFIAATDKQNPHRIFLHSAIDMQVGALLPSLFAEYRAGAGGGTPTHQHHQLHQHRSANQTPQPLIVPAAQHPAGGRGRSSGGGPSSSHQMMSSLEMSPSRPVALDPSSLGQQPVSNAELVPHINSSNAFSRVHHHPPEAQSDQLRQPVPPEHISPESLRPFQHQQIPLTSLRGRQTQAPFFTETSAAATAAAAGSPPTGGAHSRMRSEHANNRSDGGASVSVSAAATGVSPLRAAGGGSSTLSAGAGAGQLLSRLLSTGGRN